MNADALIKGRIAEHLVELLLEESGYRVVRIAREGLLNGVNRKDVKNLTSSDSAGRLMMAPSFAVLDKKGSEVFLVKVKLRTQKSSGRNIAYGTKQLQKYWPEAVLVVVTTQSPFFVVVDDQSNELPIQQFFTLITKDPLTMFRGLVEKFL